jgi:hypothetical protein
MNSCGDLEILNIDNGQLIINLKNDSLDVLSNNSLSSHMFCSFNSRYFSCLTSNGAILVYDLDNCLILKNFKNTNKLVIKSTTINSSSIIPNNANKVHSFSNTEKQINHINSSVNVFFYKDFVV